MKQKILKITGRIIVSIIILTMILIASSYNAPKEYDVLVTDIDIDPSNIDNYMIKTQLLSGEEKTFVIDNPGLNETEISKKVYKLKEGNEYHFTVIGFDILKQYETIIDLKEVS